MIINENSYKREGEPLSLSVSLHLFSLALCLCLFVPVLILCVFLSHTSACLSRAVSLSLVLVSLFPP